MRAHLVALLAAVGCSAPPAPAGWSAGSIDDGRLILWLDASQKETIALDPAGRVVAWSDRSSHHNDATAVYATGFEDDPSEPPPITLEDNTVVFRSNPIALQLQTLAIGGAFEIPKMFTRSADFLMVVVAKHTSAKDGLFVRGNSIYRTYPGPCLVGGTFASASDGFEIRNDDRTWNDDRLHAYAFGIDHVEGRAWLRVDGSTKTLDLASVEQTLERFTVGGDPDRVCTQAAEGCLRYARSIRYPLAGAIAEVMVFENTSGTDAELSYLSEYLKQKYGVGL